MKITIADLFPHEKGMILVAKDAANGRPRHITEVDNGAACNCLCFGCGRRLIARNGGDSANRAHSFAHRPEDVVTGCVTSGETALHIRAKEIIAKHRRVTLPETSTPGLDGNRVLVSPTRSVDLADIKLESVEGEVVPDVTASLPDGRRLFIEIANTHPCPPEKIKKLDTMGVDVLEIDVSGYQDHPLDELDEIIIDNAPRKLIHSAEVKAKAAEIAEREKKRQEDRLAEARNLAEIYRDPAIKNHKNAQEVVETLNLLGLSEFLDLTDVRPSAFIVYRRQWQAVILQRLFKSEPTPELAAIDAVRKFTQSKWSKEAIAYMKSDHSKWIAANVAEEFKSPYEEVLAYLKRLQKAKAVFQVSGKRFVMCNDLRKRVFATAEKLLLPEKQRKELFDAYQDIGALMIPEDGVLPDFDAWLANHSTSLGLTVDELLSDEDGIFENLMERVEAVKNMILNLQKFRRVTLLDNMAGLPLDRLIARLEAARHDAEEKAKRELAERLSRERDDRAKQIENAANRQLRSPEVWLKTPLPLHGDQTPEQLAADSQEGLEKANAVIRKILDDQRAAQFAEDLRNSLVQQLRLQAIKHIPRQDLADLWLKQHWPELGGFTPIDYCVDEKTFDRCVEELEAFASKAKKAKHW